MPSPDANQQDVIAFLATPAAYGPECERVDRIDVAKGSDAILHGPQTIGGAVNVLTRRVPDAPSGALDVAAGEGRNAIWLAQQGWQVTGADFSANGLARAARHAFAV